MDLIFHQAALGDFALTLPLLRGLDRPATVVAPWSHGRLATRLLPELRVADIEMFEFTRLYADGGPSVLSPAVQALFDEATRIVSFIAGPDSAWAQNVKRLAPQASVCFVAPRPTTAWIEPVEEWHRRQLEAQGFTPTHADAPRRKSNRKGWLIHPGSGGTSKCWPLERFASVAETLREKKQNVRFVLGEAELERGIHTTLRKLLPDEEPLICRDTDSLLTAMGDAHGFLGNDAGPTHVAAQAGLRTVALFGPSDPRVWAPVGPDVATVAPDAPHPMDWLEVPRVLDAVN